MQLGISTLGHLVDYAQQSKFKTVEELIFNATESCLKFAEQNSIKVVEILIDPQDIFQDKFKQDFEIMVNSYSLEKHVHGPFITVNLCSHNSTISQASVKAYTDTYQICRAINSNIITIHPGVASFIPGTLREINLLSLSKSIESLFNLINDSNFVISMENMPKSSNIMLDHTNIEEIYNTINNPNLFMTYDTSHFYTNNGKVEALWEKFHHIIKNVHLVENFSRISDTHPTLGSGKVNFNNIIEIIKSYQYKGSLIIELGSAHGLEKSIEFMNNIL